MYIYLMMLIICRISIAMDLAVQERQERRSPEVVVQMSEVDHQGIEVNLDDDLNLDNHAHLIKYDYIKSVEGDSYYITPKIREKNAKKALRDFRRAQPDLYRCVQNRNISARGSGGAPAASSSVPLSVGVTQQEDVAAVPMDDLIEMAANGISHAVVRKDFNFLEHTVTKERTQKAVATVILAIVSGGLAILSGYLGNQTTASC